jgi:hypothetical protein
VLIKRGKGEGEVGKTTTTPDTGGKPDRADDIQEERDDNGGDDSMMKKTRTRDNEDYMMTRIMGRVVFDV